MSDTDELSKRMKEAGMIPLNDILSGKSLLGGFDIQVGMDSLEAFEAWLKRKQESYTRSRISMELDKNTDHELYEWILAHQAAFHSIYQHFIAATKNSKEGLHK